MSTLKNKQGSLASVRQWANQNGFTVSERGAIPTAAMEAYRKALRDWAVKHNLAGHVGRVSAEVVAQFNAENIAPDKPATNGHAPRRKGTARKMQVNVPRPTAGQIREAARAAGIKISDRGRLPNSVIQDFVSNKI